MRKIGPKGSLLKPYKAFYNTFGIIAANFASQNFSRAVIETNYRRELADVLFRYGECVELEKFCPATGECTIDTDVTEFSFNLNQEITDSDGKLWGTYDDNQLLKCQQANAEDRIARLVYEYGDFCPEGVEGMFPRVLESKLHIKCVTARDSLGFSYRDCGRISL